MNFQRIDYIEPSNSKLPFAFDAAFSKTYCNYFSGEFYLLKTNSADAIYVPIIIKKSAFLKIAQFLDVPRLHNGSRLSDSDERELLDTLILHLKKEKVAHRISQGINWAIFKSYPKDSVHCQFGTYQLDLSKPEEVLWEGLHSKHRNVIRNAQKLGAAIRSGNNEIPVFYELYKSTMQRNKMSCEPLDYFKELSNHFKNSFCAVVYHDGAPQGALFVPYTSYGAYYLYGASSAEVKLTGAVNLLHWEFILFLKKQEIPLYDFVGARLSDLSGTRYEGIQRFKERFGAELVKGYLWKKDLNRLRCAFYDILLKIKLTLKGQKKPLDIIDQENQSKS